MKHRPTMAALAVAAAFGAAAVPAAANAAPTLAETGPNLVVNGGFETGDFSGWDASVSFLSGIDSLAAHGGSYGVAGGEGTLQQDIATVPGGAYNLHFWLRSDGLTPNQFTVQWGGVTVFDASDLGAFDYREFIVDPMSTGSTTRLTIGFRNDFGFLEFDDLSVRAVPEPGSLALVGLGMAAMWGWRRRRSA